MRDQFDLLSQHFVHREHPNSVETKDGLHPVVANDFSPILWVLKLLLLDVVPDMLHDLWP